MKEWTNVNLKLKIKEFCWPLVVCLDLSSKVGWYLTMGGVSKGWVKTGPFSHIEIFILFLHFWEDAKQSETYPSFFSIFSLFYILYLSPYTLIFHILKQWSGRQKVRIEGKESIYRLGLGGFLCVSPTSIHNLSFEMVSRQQILKDSEFLSNKAFSVQSYFKSLGLHGHHTKADSFWKAIYFYITNYCKT